MAPPAPCLPQQAARKPFTPATNRTDGRSSVVDAVLELSQLVQRLPVHLRCQARRGRGPLLARPCVALVDQRQGGGVDRRESLVELVAGPAVQGGDSDLA